MVPFPLAGRVGHPEDADGTRSHWPESSIIIETESLARPCFAGQAVGQNAEAIQRATARGRRGTIWLSDAERGYHLPMTNVAPVNDRELPGEAESWHRLHALVDRITPDIAVVPGYFEEGWTAKDAVAHVGTWMAHGAQMLRRIAAGTYREDEVDVDAENERFLAAMRDVPLATVHLQLAAGHAELLRAWTQLPEITPAATYWVHKAGPEHVAEHLPRLEEWIEEAGRQPR